VVRIDVGQPHVADVPRPVFDGEKDRVTARRKRYEPAFVLVGGDTVLAIHQPRELRVVRPLQCLCKMLPAEGDQLHA